MKTAVATIKKIDLTAQVMFWGLATAIVLCAGMYMYLVNKTVWNVVAVENVQGEIALLNSRLSETEFEYINTVGNVTLETAHELGFMSAEKKTVFVTREAAGKNVAFR